MTLSRRIEPPLPWVMWSWLTMYQQEGLEWQSHQTIDYVFAVKSRKLLRKIKETL